MKHHTSGRRIVTVTLNPAIDRALVVPRFRVDAVNRAQREQVTAGGKGINVATFLADYGVPVTATGFLGRDNLDLFEAHFARKQIRDRCLRVPGATRTNVKIHDPVQGTVTDVNSPGLFVSTKDLRHLLDVLGDLARDHALFVISGGLPPRLPLSTYGALVKRLSGRGRQVILDTSGPALARALAAKPSAIKPNQHELEEILGRRLPRAVDLLRAARTLVQGGIGTVVISRGKRGALFVTATEALHAAAGRAVPVHTTVGAGDAMVAGLVAATLRGLDLEATARLATAFATAAIASPRSDWPDRTDLEQLAGTSVVRRLGD